MAARMTLRRSLRWLIRLAGVLVTAAVLAVGGAREYRRRGDEDVGAHGIHAMRRVETRHGISVLHLRGSDRDAPLLLFLPGGPGESVVPLAREFGNVLERHFVVVHVENNGVGASAPFPEPPTFDELVDDTVRFIEVLERDHGRRGIYLVGHSFGSALALRVAVAHPDNVLGIATVGQAVDWPHGNELAMAQLRTLAAAESNTTALQAFDRIPPTLTRHDDAAMIDFAAVAQQRRWLEAYGLMNVSARHTPRARWWTYLTSPAHSVREACGLIYRGPCKLIAESPRWWQRWQRAIPGIVGFRALHEAPRLQMPYVAIVGSDDWVTPVALIRDYYAALEAPAKRFVEIPQAQHYAFLDQPSAFQAAVLQLLEMRREIDVAGAGR